VWSDTEKVEWMALLDDKIEELEDDYIRQCRVDKGELEVDEDDGEPMATIDTPVMTVLFHVGSLWRSMHYESQFCQFQQKQIEAEVAKLKALRKRPPWKGQ
jgi:hypothetical protein